MHVWKTRIGLFLAATLVGGGAFFLPKAAEAKWLESDFGLIQESQSHAVKIPKVRRKARPQRKTTTSVRWQAVPVHSPSCTETPALPKGGCTPSPVLDDDDDDVLVADMAANDSEKRAPLPKARSILFEIKPQRTSDPKPRIVACRERPLAATIRVRTLPKLPDSDDDAPRA